MLRRRIGGLPARPCWYLARLGGQRDAVLGERSDDLSPGGEQLGQAGECLPRASPAAGGRRAVRVVEEHRGARPERALHIPDDGLRRGSRPPVPPPRGPQHGPQAQASGRGHAAAAQRPVGGPEPRRGSSGGLGDGVAAPDQVVVDRPRACDADGSRGRIRAGRLRGPPPPPPRPAPGCVRPCRRGGRKWPASPARPGRPGSPGSSRGRGRRRRSGPRGPACRSPPAGGSAGSATRATCWLPDRRGRRRPRRHPRPRRRPRPRRPRGHRGAVSQPEPGGAA